MSFLFGPDLAMKRIGLAGITIPVLSPADCCPVTFRQLLFMAFYFILIFSVESNPGGSGGLNTLVAWLGLEV
jgi:hypothetical protein